MSNDEGQGFRRIGELVPPASTMRLVEGSTPEPSRRSSATTGMPRTAPTPGSEIGTRHSVPGAVKRSVEDMIARDDPEATDRELEALLTRSVGLSFRPVEREFIDERYGYDSEVIAFEVESGDRIVGRHIIETAMMPAPEPVIQASLARLRAATKARAVDGDDLAMTMQVMAEECAEWPADVVRAACKRWYRRETWFPSVAELRDEMQRLGRRRQLIADALR